MCIVLALATFYGFTLLGQFSLGKLLAVAVCGLWLALGRAYRRGQDWLLLPYMLVLVFGVFVSTDPWLSLWGIHGTFTTGLLCALSLVPYWVCVVPADRPKIEQGLRWSMLPVGFFALTQRLLAWPLPYPLFGGPRAYSTIGNPVYLGAWCLLCLPFCESPLELAWLGACLWAADSRGAWVAGVLGLAYRYWDRFSLRLRVWALVAILCGGAIAIDRRPHSDFGRVAIWSAALQATNARPWLGWGTGNYLTVAEVYRNPIWDAAFGDQTQDQAHNIFFEALACNGLVGLYALVLMLLALWSWCDGRSKQALLGVGIVAMLNPLPMIVKAMCVALAASNIEAQPVVKKMLQRFVKGLAIAIFIGACYLIHLDRMVKYYHPFPWVLSSEQAALRLNLLRHVTTRQQYKL